MRCGDLYLKALEIQGFKSFPDKTVLAFGSDITAVVGPNGSGKSNIADAIRWVMGEQSTRPAWTSEALANLIKNALDHTHASGVIRILWETSPAALRITVTDNGDGISPEDLPHIFKRFYRSSQSQDRQGAGLGLSLAKSIIEGQDGILSVRSVPHVETAFTVLFPL